MTLSRRAVLAGLGATAGTLAWADGVTISLRPRARPTGGYGVEALISRAELNGSVSVFIADHASGQVIKALGEDRQQPPASVSKAFTALYALETLGPEFRFQTSVYTSAPVENGVLDGDLILAGGGNPNLVTDDLAVLARSVKEAGLREVRGKFYVWGGALPRVDEIDDSQQDYFGYNPTVGGLNLNFNRVHFEWKREGDDFSTVMDARSENYRPAVTGSRIQIVDRAAPVFTYRDDGDLDRWTVARSALNAEGSRWLPVRHPALYAGEVFATFARSHGIVLTAAEHARNAPSGRPLAEHQSEPLRDLMRGMLRFSTNLTAEATGMLATGRRLGRPSGMQASAREMAGWLQTRCGVSPSFVDHSGLGDRSRLTASDMVQMLRSQGVRSQLYPILKDFPIFEDPATYPNVTAKAKTGTLNFVSTLGGYLTAQSGRVLSFAIFAADLNARARGKALGDEQPPGARGWGRRARALQRDILAYYGTRL